MKNFKLTNGYNRKYNFPVKCRLTDNKCDTLKNNL